MPRFTCTDESLNSYGFWVLTSGIDTGKFMKNPIMLWNHSRSYGSRNDVLPIGYWKDLKVEGGKLSAEAVFDEKDDFARTIAEKVRQGVVRACSIGIRILSTSMEEAYLKPGQTRETVVACELREISLCDIPSNGNAVAVALYDDHDRLLSLSEWTEATLPLLIKKHNTMNKILTELGLADNATEESAVAKIKELRKEMEDLRKERREAQESALREEVEQAVRTRCIPGGKKDAYMEIGRKSGLAALKSIFSDMAPLPKASQVIHPGNGMEADKKFSELEETELEALRKDDPNRYAELFEAEYGFKPDMD